MKANIENSAMRSVKATINLKALKFNLSRVKTLAPDSRVISVIKANAYGHGILAVAKALHESDSFAVARLEEALFLRNNGINKKIILLEGVFSRDEYIRCAEQGVIPIIHCLEQFQWLQECVGLNNGFEYWLKVDTGMHRLGLSDKELQQLLTTIALSDVKLLPAGIMSHFSCADEISNVINEIQLTQFNKFCSQKVFASIDKSMANSAAILSLPKAHFNWVRPGIMLYGISPFEALVIKGSGLPTTGLDEQLKPVMTLSSELIAIKKLKQGDCIGYGASWCCPEDMTVGVVAIGYGDGYPRHAPSGTPVLIHGIEVPLVGRVSMDMITVDLRLFDQQLENKHKRIIHLGDKVILWGDGLPIERVSQKAGTIAYELLCQVTQRVYFEYE
jgi:alanine racemase